MKTGTSKLAAIDIDAMKPNQFKKQYVNLNV
jgi:hypothetical protein